MAWDHLLGMEAPVAAVLGSPLDIHLVWAAMLAVKKEKNKKRNTWSENYRC